MPLFGLLLYKYFVKIWCQCHLHATKLSKLKRLGHTNVTEHQKARRQKNSHFQFREIQASGFYFALLETRPKTQQPSEVQVDG